jgi:hypothetical protein
MTGSGDSTIKVDVMQQVRADEKGKGTRNRDESMPKSRSDLLFPTTNPHAVFFPRNLNDNTPASAPIDAQFFLCVD